MYIHDIKSIFHFGDFRNDRGIVFDTREELIAAIRTLGYMLEQDESLVDALIERMLADVDTGMARSGLVNALMRGESEPAGPVKGSATLTEGGWVVGGRFSEHNTFGLPVRGPFRRHSLRINRETNDEGGSRYRLSVTDNVSPTSLDPARVGLYYTESLLAAQLGRPRLMTSVCVCAFYAQDGPEVEFSLAPLIDALNSIDCLAEVERSPEDIALGYFEHERDSNFDDFTYQIRLVHANGCIVQLSGFYGIQDRDDTIGRRLLIRCDGHRLVGPYNATYGKIGPFVEFGVAPPKSADANDPAAVLAANQLAVDLADALTTALWSYNLG